MEIKSYKAGMKSREAIGAIVALPGLRHAVIFSERRISKGKFAGRSEYKVAPLAGSWGNAYQATVTGESLFQAPSASFSTAEVQAAITKSGETSIKVAERKEERAEAGRVAQGEVDWSTNTRSGGLATDKMKPGDTVMIKWSNIPYPTAHKLLEINRATGKIAIEARGNKSGKRWINAALVKEVKPC